MSEIIFPASDYISVYLGPKGTGLVRKQARDIVAGDYVWCFIVESQSPVVTGHFRFVEVTKPPKVEKRRALRYQWFSQQDGPTTFIPCGWHVFADGSPLQIDGHSQLSAYAMPGFAHDDIPLAIDLELFSDSFSSPLLTEAAAYFLGAFSVRPQCYAVDGNTWGIFGARLNTAGEYGLNQVKRRSSYKAWQLDHRAALERMATSVWGAGNFFVEQVGSPLGLPDEAVPAGHVPDRFLSGRSSPVGFVIHAPIARGISLKVSGAPGDADLRVLQYWYSFLTSHLIERSNVPVRRAFLLGALDTVSNADKNRKSVGIDWPDRFTGEFPMYSAIHTVGRNTLDTFEADETGNPRRTPTRTRGRMARSRIWEQTQAIGFISELRLARAIAYEPSIAMLPRPTFPTPNALSVLLGVDVGSVSNASGYGANEGDLTKHPMVGRVGSPELKEFVLAEVQQQNACAVSSLPLGSFSASAHFPVPGPVTGTLALARGRVDEDALEKIFNISQYLSQSTPPADMIFEYLVAVLVSCLPACLGARVVPRHEDQGVDVTARFGMGSVLGEVTIVVQAKCQAKPVGRRVIDQIRGALFREKAAIGFVVTNNGFTTHATRSARQDYPEIRLIDGRALVAMLKEHKVGLKSSGSGAHKKYSIDLQFFEQLRALAAMRRDFTDHTSVYLDPKLGPAVR